jgi:hypothetical protein
MLISPQGVARGGGGGGIAARHSMSGLKIIVFEISRYIWHLLPNISKLVSLGRQQIAITVSSWKDKT